MVTLHVQVVGTHLGHWHATCAWLNGRRWHVDEDKAERLEDERDEEQKDGISAQRRGSSAAPSDKPEGTAPHPQDVNEIAE
jgi:hypothetical protein